jgi:Protein of unknown function (DUF4199)
MQAVSRYAVGLRFGLITGLLYVLLLFLRYKFFSFTPPSFFYISLITYFIILMMFLITGIARKRELGGYAELQEIFQSIFITILITELSYVLFNFIYMKYVNPGFLENFKETSLAYYKKMGHSPEQIHTEMDSIHALSEGMKPFDLLKGFGTIVVIDSIFGFIFAAIVRRKKPIPVVEPKI